MENFVQWIEKILMFLKQYGFVNIVKSCITMILFSITMTVVFSPKKLISSIVELVQMADQEIHASNEDIRKQITPIINTLLDNSIEDLGCSRAFVMEGHNGKSNRNGLGFYYVDMTYERCKNTSLDQSVYWQYRDMPTSIFSFFNYLDTHRYFYGDVDELSKIDNKLSQMIKANNTNFIVIVEIPKETSANKFVGILGYSFTDDPKLSQESIKTYMLEVRRRVKTLLSLTSLKGVDLNQYKERICLN